jgi:hypothetical protein
LEDSGIFYNGEIFKSIKKMWRLSRTQNAKRLDGISTGQYTPR